MMTIEIRKWMLDMGISQTRIWKELGLSRSIVSRTIKGERRNQAVLDWLRGNGCPAEFLTENSGGVGKG
jgi:predicted transcriptional regulator